MPSNYKVQIKPVQENRRRVIEIVMEYLGPDRRLEAEQLVEEGGVVLGDLNRDAAEQVKQQLERAGAMAEIVTEEEPGEELPDALEGRVRGIESGRPVEGAEVTIRPADPDMDETFGMATTREDGTFTLPRFGVFVREFFPETDPKLQVTVVRNGQEVKTRHKPFDWESFAQGDYTFEIEAAAPTTVEDGKFTVSGLITRSNGEPATGVVVRAYDRDLRRRQLLGETATGGSGEYEITYTPDQFRRAEKERADLVMSVVNEAGTELEVDSDRSDTIFNARRKEVVNLQVISGELIELSEYEQLVQALTPLLEGVPLADLTEDDLDFLSKDTGRDPSRIRFLSQDAQLSQEHDVREAVFYGFARRDVGILDGEAGPRLDLETLLEQNNDTLRSHLNDAISNRIIPVQLRESLDDIIGRLETLRAEHRERQREGWPKHELTGRLLNQETDAPLAGYTVDAIDKDAQPEPKDLGRDFTGEEGRFTLSYRTPPEESEVPREIGLTVLSRDGEELATRVFNVQPDQPEELEWRIELPEPEVPGDGEQIQDLGVEPSVELNDLLEEHDLKTLADVRNLGGLTRIEGFEDDESARTLQAHADLSVLPSDSQARTVLIENGYNSPLEIAKAPVEEFVGSVGEDVENPGQLHSAASAAKRTVDDLVTEVRTNWANGLSAELLGDLKPIGKNVAGKTTQKCECRDCESAVSPAAYLADLTQYVIDHVTEHGNTMLLDRLEALFHQPFGDLPVSCEASQEELRQVRICIEVLLRHLGKSRIQFLKTPSSKGGEYRKQLYDALLNRFGTSREELRLVQKASDDERQALARRLGIPVNHLDDLVLDPAAPLNTPSALTEDKLEQLFGVPAFTYWKSGSLILPAPLRNLGQPDFQSWQLQNLRQQWATEDRLSDVYTVYTGGERPIIDPDVTGLDDFRIPDASTSYAFKIWKNRRTWVDKQLQALRGKMETIHGETVPQLEGTGGLFDLMRKDITYAGTTKKPWKGAPKPAKFDDMLRKLDEGTNLEATRKKITTKLHLTVESFTRLVQLWQKHQKWTRDVRYPKVTDEEWREVYSILTQAQKRAFYGAWMSEEVNKPIVFGPQTFWISLREPAQGRWSSALNASYHPNTPFIDPERDDLDELPEHKAGAQAIALWSARQSTLEGKRAALGKTYRKSGFDAVLNKEVYPQGPPAGYSSWDKYFEDRTLKNITSDLTLDDEEAARKLKSVRARATTGAAPSGGSTPPSTEELEEVFALLTTAWKRQEKYSDWVRDEKSKGLTTYWKARKARLPKWRAGRAHRQQWQQALRSRSQRPIIDPDLLVPGDDLAEPVPANTAFAIWKQRDQAMTQEVKDAQNIVSNNQLDDREKFKKLVRKWIGVSRKELADVAAQEEKGKSIDGRLGQLTLNRRAFNYLVDVDDRIENGVSISDDTWEDVVHIVVAVSKKRRFAAWQGEEGIKHVPLTPEDFRLADRKKVFDRFDDESPKRWRMSLEAMREWRDTLEARTEQRDQAKAALRDAISQAQEETLTILRDALIEQLRKPSKKAPFGEKAEWASERLLIDTEESGCRETTRVAQATESLQTLLFALDTGQDTGGLTTLGLSIDDEHFDERWKWLETYARWKSARGIYLYPESILMPTLRKRETPRFGDLVEGLRSGREVSDKLARSLADEYAEYFHDVCTLSFECACHVETYSLKGPHSKWGSGGPPQEYFEVPITLHMFARGGKTEGLYWSRYELPSLEGVKASTSRQSPYTKDTQSFWRAVDFKDLEEVVGAVQFREKLYLFATTHSDGVRELSYKTLDVETGQWSGKPQTIDLPIDQPLMSVAVEERNGIESIWDDQRGVLYDTFPADRSPHLVALFENGNMYNVKLKPDIMDRGDFDVKPRAGGGTSSTADSDEQDKAGSAERWTLLRGGDTIPFNDNQLQEICAVVEHEGGYCLIVRDESGILWYRLLIPRYDDGHWNKIGEGIFKGTISWQALGDQPPLIYIFYGSGEENRWLTQVRQIEPSEWSYPQSKRIGTREEFAKWIRSVAGYYPLHGWTNGKPILSDIEDGLNKDGPEGDKYRLADKLCRRFSKNDLSLLDVFEKLTRGKVTPFIEFRYRKKSGELDAPKTFKAPHRFIGSSCGYFTADRNQFISESEAPVEELVRTRLRQEEQARHSLSTNEPIRVRPSLDGPFGIKDATEIDNTTERRKAVEEAFKDNRNTPKTIFTYLEEAYYFVAMLLARRLSQSGNYNGALDWYRMVYDYSLSGDSKIWHGLTKNGKGKANFAPGTSWLTDPLNPHTIAERRPNTGTKYTQFTLFSIIQCLLDYADDEFASDTGESVQRARTLYETALDLLQVKELKQLQHPCDELTVEIAETIGSLLSGDDDGAGSESREMQKSMMREIEKLDDPSTLREIDQRLAELNLEGQSSGERVNAVEKAIDEVKGERSSPKSIGTALDLHADTERTVFRTLLSDDTVARTTSQRAMQVLSKSTRRDDSTPEDGSTGNGVNIEYETVSMAFCIPANPVLKSLRQHAELNLKKIRTCRNFAGMRRELEPYAAPAGVESAAPSLGGDGAVRDAQRTNIQPTDYRYDTLIARTKELVNVAQQIEASFLSAIESRDKEAYKLLQARQDLELAREGVRLESLRVQKARDRVQLTKLQKEKAQFRVNEYQDMIEAGLNKWEEKMISEYKAARMWRKDAALAQQDLREIQYLFGGLSADPVSIAAKLVSLPVYAINSNRLAKAQRRAIEAEFTAQIASVKASFARRKQRWEMQKAIASQDVEIRSQQIDIAQQTVDVTRQQREIAEIETDHAKETIEFLQDEQFTNVELYDWMADVLEGVYRYFLQQATSTAKLAERQLAFERQELPQQFIGSGYWHAPREGRTSVDRDEETPDRRGLTGSARLLRDIYQLDQYAFRTDERKQQVSKTISLAQLAPFELQQFRETGVLSLDTDRELFERDHPGHHLRLIKNVSVSVIALTPPTDGIKAELRNSGISRVVTSGPPFRTEVIRRDPEMITLSSPQNDTGVFQLKPEGEMLMPFEKTGVDTSWELRMPKAANAFDYDTIADVLLTINYTALQSDTYRQQVIKRLDPEQSGQRAFSFSDEFADPWYNLHNPAQTDDPMTVRFKTRRIDFPPNLDDVEIENVLLYYVTEDGVDTEELKTTLTLTPEDGQGPVGGEATPVEQRISTRRGNGSSWMPMVGKSVAGEWELSLPNTAKVKRMFDEEKIEDMLFVITYEGRTPAWS